MVGTDTTSSKASRPQEGPEHVVKEAHWAVVVLRPCLRSTVECRYHEREVLQADNPGQPSPYVLIASASRAAVPSYASEVRIEPIFSVNKPKRKDVSRSAPKAHYTPLQQMRVFGGTGEPRELVRCAWYRGLIVPNGYAVEGKEPKKPLVSFFFSKNKKKKHYKEIRLSDETKQPPTDY